MLRATSMFSGLGSIDPPAEIVGRSRGRQKRVLSKCTTKRLPLQGLRGVSPNVGGIRRKKPPPCGKPPRRCDIRYFCTGRPVQTVAARSLKSDITKRRAAGLNEKKPELRCGSGWIRRDVRQLGHAQSSPTFARMHRARGGRERQPRFDSRGGGGMHSWENSLRQYDSDYKHQIHQNFMIGIAAVSPIG